MKVTLYNGGERIYERMAFSLTQEKSDQTIGYQSIDLPSKKFTELDTELELAVGTIRVEFPYDLLRNHGKKGVVMVITRKEADRRFGVDGEIPEDQPFALTENDAISRGDRIADEYTHSIALAYLNECDESQAKGGVLRKAGGYIKRCLDKHNIVDPYEKKLQDQGIVRQPSNPEVQALRAQVAALQSMMERILAGKQPSPESPSDLPDAPPVASAEPEPVAVGAPAGPRNARSVQPRR